MAGIKYTASTIAPLVTSVSPAHVAGVEYSIDVKLTAYIEGVDLPKTVHLSLAGTVETVLRRANNTAQITLIWPNSQDEDMMEFLYSIAAGEAFSFDPYGTIASPDSAAEYVCLNLAYNISRVSHGSAPWRSVSLSLRPI